MKKVLIKINIKESNFAFMVEKNFKDTVIDLLAINGILDVIKNSQLEKIGKLERREIESNE